MIKGMKVQTKKGGKHDERNKYRKDGIKLRLK